MSSYIITRCVRDFHINLIQLVSFIKTKREAVQSLILLRSTSFSKPKGSRRSNNRPTLTPVLQQRPPLTPELRQWPLHFALHSG